LLLIDNLRFSIKNNFDWREKKICFKKDNKMKNKINNINIDHIQFIDQSFI